MRQGTTVGERYRLTQGPFTGGMGEVWLARDLLLPREVVLKRLHTTDAGVCGYDRLSAEGRALAHLSHTHVVTLHDVLTLSDGGREPVDDDPTGRPRRMTSWLVMEYVSGGSLDGRPPLSPERAARVGAQIAAALAALHAKRIVHGDVKPGNVVVTPEGLAKLADFGAAYRVDSTETITPNGAVSYTPDYAAPEMVAGRPEPASDIFSLGCTLYALVAGDPPRPEAAEDAGPYLAGLMAGRGDIELTADTGVLAALLPAMLARNPAHRPTAPEARRLLEEIAGPQDPLPQLEKADEPGAGSTGEADESRVGSTGEPDAPKPAEAGPEPRGGREGGAGPLNGRASGSRAQEAGSPGSPELPSDGHRPAVPAPSRGFLVAAVAAVLALTLVVLLVVELMSGGGREKGRTVGKAGPGASGSAASPPVSVKSASVFGDHRTADLCALADPAVLGRFGEAELDRDYGNFDRCDVIVETGDEGAVDVKFWYDTTGPSEPATPQRTVGSVSVWDEAEDSDACVKGLRAAGDPDVTVMVVAEVDGDRTGAPLCEIAEAATGHAAEVLNRGRLPRRSPDLPADSLIHQDACTLLGADALEAVPDIDAEDPDIGFGNWDCEWHSTTSDLYVELRFDRDQPPTAAEGVLTRIDGRTAVAEPDVEDADTCRIRVVHRSYVQDGSAMVETLNLTVGGDPSARLLRRLATQLATAASAGARAE
ncbi:serine/threonine-protein kinase [Streptomyces sp. NL15-2K]|uniref:protein kinase domain-containing protein n=1 Tax=Streptomyces sp. NL15-2K TaxID=376149 RepID=UPI000F560AA9|nr:MULTISPECIES: serine/threonine-protein kinase [Actinomycetes]WKX06274.1 protein kinase [Kutzneria buriramensis]GCB52867.1 serine/threonine protein kinase [Streptomyces sp. NL15-2K]